MKDFCTCGSRPIEGTFRQGNFVRCSNCSKPARCDAGARDDAVGPHAAEITQTDHLLCWRHHWQAIANLDVSHFVSRKATP